MMSFGRHHDQVDIEIRSHPEDHIDDFSMTDHRLPDESLEHGIVERMGYCAASDMNQDAGQFVTAQRQGQLSRNINGYLRAGFLTDGNQHATKFRLARFCNDESFDMCRDEERGCVAASCHRLCDGLMVPPIQAVVLMRRHDEEIGRVGCQVVE